VTSVLVISIKHTKHNRIFPVEIEVGYKAKVPINDNGFGYSVSFISIDVLRDSSYYAQDFIVNDSYYSIAQGNLYFSKSIEEIISEKYIGFDDALKSGLTQSLIYYKVHIYFDVFVPDTSDETHRLALTQATQHVIMDYFNQYTYAEVTANMISEIAYTETLTFWSTVISSAAIYFGSWAVGGGTLQSFAMAGVGIVKTAIKEVFEEIIKDSFIESLIENFFDIRGWSEDLAMWVSALATSAREVTGALGQLALSTKSPMKTDISLMLAAKKAGDVNTFTEIKERLDLALKEQIKAQQQKEDQKKSRARLLFSGFFKGLFMVMPSILFGSFTFLTLKGLSTIGKGAINLMPNKFAAFKAKVNAFKKGNTGKLTGENSRFYWKDLNELLKKPSDLDSKKEDVNNKFKERSENLAPPLVDVLNSINSHSNINDIQARESLAQKFNTIAFEQYFTSWIDKLGQEERFKEMEEAFQKVRTNYREISVQAAEKAIIDLIKDALNKPGNTALRFVNMFGVEFYDPNFILLGMPIGTNAKTKNNILKQDYFKSSLTTLDKVNELKDQFDIDKNLEMYALDGINMIKIPVDSTTIIAEWLEDHDFGSNSKIIVLADYIPTKGKAKFTRINWDPDGDIPSPFLPEWEEFVVNIGRLLEGVGLISTDATLQGLTRYKLPVSSLDSSVAGIYDVDYSMSRVLGKTFAPTSQTLDRWYIKMKELIDDHFRSRSHTINPQSTSGSQISITSFSSVGGQHISALKSLDLLFSQMYDDFGISSVKPYSQSTRLVLKKLAIYLKEKKLITSDAVKQLSEVIDYQEPSNYYKTKLPKRTPHSLENTLEHILIRPVEFILQKQGFVKLQGDLQITIDFDNKVVNLEQDYLKVSFNFEGDGEIKLDIDSTTTMNAVTEELKESIFGIVKPYLIEVANFWSMDESFFPDSIKNQRGFTRSIRREFMLDIVKAGNFFDLSLRKLSKLFYKTPRSIYKHFDLEHMNVRPDIGLLDNWKFITYNWDYNTFKQITGKDITKLEFTLIQQSVIDALDSWVLEHQYLDDSLIKIKNGKRSSLLYDVASRVKLAAMYEKGQTMSYTTVESDFGLSNGRFQTTFRGLPTTQFGRDNLKEDLEKMYVTIAKWHEAEFGERGAMKEPPTGAREIQKLMAYQGALRSIYKLVKETNLDFTSPTINKLKLIYAIDNDQELIMNEYDRKNWKNAASKAYIRVFQFAKRLGVDPLTFRINPDTSLFDPHHFKAFKFRQMSTHNQDLIETSKRFHRKYEVLYKTFGRRGAEVYVETLIKSLEELLSLKDSVGNIRDITDADIKRVLRANFGPEWESVYKGWVSDFTVEMAGIDNYKDSLYTINDLRNKYLPGNTAGNDYQKFLEDKYPSIFQIYKSNLQGKVIDISRVIATQADVDYFNILYRSHTRIRLV